MHDYEAKMLAVRDAGLAAMQEKAESLGLGATYLKGLATQSGTQFTFHISQTDGDGKPQTPEREALKHFRPDLVDRKVNTGKGLYTVVGWRRKARKNKLLIQRVDGKTFTASEDYIRYCIGREEEG